MNKFDKLYKKIINEYANDGIITIAAQWIGELENTGDRDKIVVNIYKDPGETEYYFGIITPFEQWLSYEHPEDLKHINNQNGYYSTINDAIEELEELLISGCGIHLENLRKLK